MEKKNILYAGLLFFLVTVGALFFPSDARMYEMYAADPKATSDVVHLPEPRWGGGRPLMQILRERRTQRSFSTRELPLQVVSELLWAAFGINRPESGGRTAPSSHNAQEIEIYVALSEGLYRYLPEPHQLRLIVQDDFRTATASIVDIDYVSQAPLTFIYVADTHKQTVEAKYYAATGFIGQNVYLYCASEELATVVRSGIPREELSSLIGLPDDQVVTLCQTIGYAIDQEPDIPGDVNGDGIIDGTSILVDQDGNGIISIGDTFTHTYEDGMTVPGVIGENHVGWLTGGGYTLDAAGLEAAANALENNLRWTNVQLISVP